MALFKIKKSTDAKIKLRLPLIASKSFVNFRCSFLLLLIAQKKIQKLVKTFCKGVDVKVVLIPFKISNKFSYKDPLPFHLQSFIVYKFVCANCKVCYVGETTRHFITRINEHLQKDAKSNIFKHQQESHACNSVCNKDCFSMIDQTTAEYQLKMKEAMYIKWIRPKLNKQVKYYIYYLNSII